MSNYAWLCNYDDCTNVYGMVIQTAEFDGVQNFKLEQKKKYNEITDEELKIYENLDAIGLNFWKSWKSQSFIKNESLPNKLFKEPDINYSNLPNPKEHFFKITSGYLILSQKLYNVISQFNLGKTHFSQVFIYDIETGEQLSDIPYYFINIAESYDFLDKETSNEITVNEYQPTQPMRWIRVPKDGDIKLSYQNDDFSIDLWHEQYLNHSLFFSDRLVQALLDAGFTKKELGLIRCVIQ